MFDILFEKIDVITMRDERPVLRGAYVGIEAGRIAYVGEVPPADRAKRNIGGCRRLLMPGLVNCHAHAAMSVLRGYADDYALQEWLFQRVFPAEARLDRRAVVAGFSLGAAEMIRNGVTSFSDMYMFIPDAAAFAAEAGLRANLCNAILSLSEDGGEETARILEEAAGLLETLHGTGDGRIRADVGIHAEYTSRPADWLRVAEFAREHGLVTQLHLSETREEHDACVAKTGKTPARLFYENGVFDSPVIAAHCVWVSDEDMDLMAKKRVSCAHAPVSNLKLASGIARVAAMLRRGVNVCLGTDGCCSNNTHDLFEELKLAPLLQKGLSLDPMVLPAYEALRLATVNGALAQGRDGEIGCVEAGYEADLIMLDMDSPHLIPSFDPVSTVVYCARGSDVALSMVQGRVLYENGAFTTMDIEKIKREVLDYAAPLVRG